MIRQESKQLDFDEHEYDLSVADYLRSSPEFFERNPDLLLQLSLPHQERGSVSLVERRMALQRQEYRELRQQLDEIVEIAQHNDQLSELLHDYAVGLMNATSLQSVFDFTLETLVEKLHCEDCNLYLYRNEVLEICADQVPDFVKLVSADFGLAVKQMHTRRSVYCGYATTERRQRFFPRSELNIQSLAVLRLHSERDYGYLALASEKQKRFAPRMGIDFLVRFGALLGSRLAVFFD